MLEDLEQRKRKIWNIIKNKKTYFVYIVLIIIIWFGSFIRTRNLQFLKDATTGKYIPLALDPFVVLRYANYILEHGKIMVLDTMRNYPIGFNPIDEFSFISNFIVYLYKFIHIFNGSVTLEQIHVLYPIIAFAIGIFFFFLTMKKLCDYKIALISSTFLIAIPTYLYRTMAGFSDKESLAMMLMFMVFYFYVGGWHSKKISRIILFGIISGVITGATALVWGGVGFIFLIISFFTFIELFLGKFKKKDFYLIASWVISLTIIMVFFSYGKYRFSDLVVSFTTGIAFLAFLIAIIRFIFIELDLFKIKNKITTKLPPGIFSFIISIVIIIIITSLLYGATFIYNQIGGILHGLIYPLGDRWALTVAESHQPYIKDWFSQFGSLYLWLFLVGSLVLWYNLVKPLGRKKWWLSAGYFFFIIFFIFSRYSPESKYLNGVTPLAKFLYIGSFMIFFGGVGIFYLYSFYKNKELFNGFLRIDKNLIFILVWFIVMVMAARSAVRLIFVFSSITAVLVGYLGMKGVDYASLFKNKFYKYGIIALVVIILIIAFNSSVISSYNQAKFTGPSYNLQWQKAGEWVRENTNENAVFAHWWDYGYWVQTGFERATITDGGNVIGSWNYFMGRHVLMGHTEEEALEFLKTHDATHLLMISDEIGKYPAFSSIGSDQNYDKYSWINTFNLDTSQTQELRNKTILVYRGTFALDEDFVYEDNLFPGSSSGIGAILIPVTEKEDGINFERPQVVLFYRDKQVNVPLDCVFYDGKEIVFGDDGMHGCFMFIPTIEGNNQGNPVGAGLYLSNRVRQTLFAKLYLYGQESSNFKVVYNDESNLPLAIYQGRLIGPLKIWEISYPSDIKTNPDYLKATYPDIFVTYI